MARCNACPRRCNAERTANTNTGGYCRMPLKVRLARAGLHFWEEPCISGTHGSGTIFFSGCSLRCVFCQNEQISHKGFGKDVSIERLTEIFAELEAKGAHNIIIVNPTHYFEQIERALSLYRPKIPIVYNSGGYDLPEQIGKNVFDIYLFDLKYISSQASSRYSGASDYFQFASSSILTACKLLGAPQFDTAGILQRGVVVRHLLLPQGTREAIAVFDWLQEYAPQALFSLMAQYFPAAKAHQFAEINRKITKREYEKVVSHILEVRSDGVYLQERSSASKIYVPDFDFSGI